MKVREEKICLACNSKFICPKRKNGQYLISSQVWKSRQFCSQRCSNSINSKKAADKLRGVPRSKESVEKTASKLRGVKRTPLSEQHRAKMVFFDIGHIPWNKDIKTGVTPWKGKTRPSMTGSNNWKWIADRSSLKQNDKKHLDGRYKEWARAVKFRDNWKCRISKDSCKGRLEAHHILNWVDYTELRYEINNGITLCQHHHPKGRKNEAKLSPFFQKLVAEMK